MKSSAWPDLFAQQQGEDLILQWPHASEIKDKVLGTTRVYRHAHLYEVRRGPHWAHAHRICQRVYGCRIRIKDFCAGVTETYWIRRLSLDGRYEGRPKSISVTTTHPQDHTDASIRDETSVGGGWPGTHTDTQVDSGALVLAAGKTSGTYESDEIDLGSEGYWRLGWQCHPAFVDSTRTINGQRLTVASGKLNFSPSDPQAKTTPREIGRAASTVWAFENCPIDNIYAPSVSYKIEATVYATSGNRGDWEPANPGRWHGRYLKFRVTITRNDAATQTISLGTFKTSISKVASGASGAADLDGLTDVTLGATPYAAGRFLRADGAQYVDATIAAGDLPSHEHAASQVTSGTLGLNRGGTAADLSGAAASRLIRMNAATNALEDSGKTVADFAQASHPHAAGEITSGTLALTQGGAAADLSGVGAYSLLRMNSGKTALEESGVLVDGDGLLWVADDFAFEADPSYDQALIGVGPNVGRQLILADADMLGVGLDWNHAPCTHPTFIVHSGNDPVVNPDEYLALYHDGGRSWFVGMGNTVLSPEGAVGINADPESWDCALQVWQVADYDGIKISGYDDEDDQYFKMYVGADGSSCLESSNYLRFYTGAGQNLYFDCGGSFYFRDIDDSFATRMQLVTGSDYGDLRLFDEDQAEYLRVRCTGGYGRISTIGTSPQALVLQDNANCDVECFSGAGSGETPAFKICGYKSGASLTTLSIAMSAASDDRVEFSGLTEYDFDGVLIMGTLRVPQFSSDPGSPVNGDTWINTADYRLKSKIGGSVYYVQLTAA